MSHLERIHKDFSGFKYGSATINTNIVYTGSYNERKYADGGTAVKKVKRKKSTLAKYFGDNETIKMAENAGILPCPKCPQVFTRKNILRVHLKLSHENEIKADEENGIDIDQKPPIEIQTEITESSIEKSIEKIIAKSAEIAEKVPEKSKKSPIKDELKVKVMKRKRQRISQPPQSKPQDTEDEILAIGE